MTAMTVTKCPICKKPAAYKYRPFCSARCADIDLGRWATESYRLPTDDAPDLDNNDSDNT